MSVTGLAENVGEGENAGSQTRSLPLKKTLKMTLHKQRKSPTAVGQVEITWLDEFIIVNKCILYQNIYLFTYV